MLVLFWALLFTVTGLLCLLAVCLSGRETYRSFAGVRAVTCPESRSTAAVSFDALHSAITGLSGKPQLRLAACTRWPERANCGQECITEAQAAAPYTEGEVVRGKSREIAHLPIVVSAALAWVIGAVAHSQYLFRGEWQRAAGIDNELLREGVNSLAPHVLSFTALLLFGYGVAWLLAVVHRGGIDWGVAASTVLWFAVFTATFLPTQYAGISPYLLKLELAYTFIASVIMGTVIGAANWRRILAHQNR